MANGDKTDREIENAIEKITLTSASARANNDISAIIHSPVGESVDQAIYTYLKERKKNGITLLDGTSLSTNQIRKRKFCNASREICQIDILRNKAKKNITKSSGILIPMVSTIINESFGQSEIAAEYLQHVEDVGKGSEFLSQITDYKEDMQNAKEICAMTLSQKNYVVIENVRSGLPSGDLYFDTVATIGSLVLLNAIYKCIKNLKQK